MNKLRNPFRMRASEKIESDANFLRIYSPLALDSLLTNNKESKLWGNVTYLHSSPGGGKTSLLRIFEPSVLNTIFNSKTSYQEIFQRLKQLEAVDEQVKVLGIYLLCSRNFELLDDIDIQTIHKKRLFYSLLNSRLILATLKSILILKNKRFPEGLNDILFQYQDTQNYFKGLTFPCTGKDLYDWAAEFEDKIFSALDSLIPLKEAFIPGHDGLFAFSVMSPNNFIVDNSPICEKFLFMLDDAHKLSHEQRKSIRAELIEQRGLYTLFIAERIEALDTSFNVDHVNIKNRDYQFISLEEFFKNKNDKKLEMFLASIGEKRAGLSSDNLTTFKNNLSDVLNEEKYKTKYENSIKDSLSIFKQIASSVNRFSEWFGYAESLKSKFNYKEYALFLKQVEILVYRNLGNSQFDFPLLIEELNLKLDSVKSPAEYFICRDYHIPYYYDFKRLVKISSYNVEQFLSFSSELFERMLSNHLLGNNTILNPEEQESIINDLVCNKWKNLPNNIPYSSLVIKFLQKIGEFCKQESNQPNAPYNAGINGFGMNDFIWYKNSKFESLANVIATCVAINLLEADTVSQGIKGQMWNVYYLNRWLCVYFRLPLTYGNWRPKKPTELIKWLK